MRFYNYLNEVISTTKIEKIVDTYMDIVRGKFKRAGGTKNVTNIIKKEVTNALKEIVYDLYGIDKTNKLKVSLYKKQNSKNFRAWAWYDSTSSMGDDVITIGVKIEIGDRIINYAVYNDNERPKIFRELGEIITHEVVHVIQNYRSNWNNPYRKSYYGNGREYSLDIKDKEGFKVYLSFPEEISAYAAETAMTVLRYRDKQGLNISADKLIKVIGEKKTLKFLSNLSVIFGQYYEFFGKHKESEASQKVWKKFIKEFIYHIRERIDNE